MDPKLKLKPIELLDVGIDKLTKIPIPILNENMLSTYDMDNGVPADSFLLSYNASFGNFYATITSSDSFNLYIDWGDGTNESNLILTGGTVISHTYTSAITYNIIATGWLEKIINLNISNGGISSVSINYLKKLVNLNLSNNILTKINLENLIYLKYIYLENNYFSNDEIDDIYNTADTFLTFGGIIDTTGINNGKPSVYSSAAIESLSSKFWTLNFNT
jgi:hypothetical protein